MHLKLLAAVIAALANVAASLPTGPGNECRAEPPTSGSDQPQGLHQAMTRLGKTWFGTALTIHDDKEERAIIDNTADFGSVTPEDAMKWEHTERERGVFTFDGSDAVVNVARANGQQIHCHTLVWHGQLAAWVEAGNFDNATLIQIMTDHIEAVAGRYKDDCTRWDVVNEALNDDGTYRESVWYKTIGEAYIPLAFAITARVSPKSKLYYNDYSLEQGSPKTAGARRLVELVQSYGVRIDGVGFQAHLSITPDIVPTRAALAKTLQSVTALGVDVAYTELDIWMTLPSTPEKLALQAEAYARVAGSCVDVQRCVGITAWGITDKYSWLERKPRGNGAAVMWDRNYQKRPSYDATLKTLSSAHK